MNWGGICLVVGFASLAVVTWPYGTVLIVAGAVWLWRKC